MILKGYEIERDKVPEYFSSEVMAGIEFYMTYKTLGMPYAGGWAEQPCHVIDIIKTLEIEEKKWRTT